MGYESKWKLPTSVLSASGYQGMISAYISTPASFYKVNDLLFL